MNVGTLFLMIFLLIWFTGAGRTIFDGRRQIIKSTVHDVGSDLKSAGRDVAISIRHTVK